MSKLKEKDKKNRSAVKKFEKKRFVLKSIIKNLNYSNLIRWNALGILMDFPINSSENRLINRCVLTGRKKRMVNLYSYSRIVFINLVRCGLIHGMSKSKW